MGAELPNDEFVVGRKAVVLLELRRRALFGREDQSGVGINGVRTGHGTSLRMAL
jgi:hypothetical protein